MGSLTSFAKLEAAIRGVGGSDAEVAAAKRAAALGCTDVEVEQAAQEAYVYDHEVVKWRKERSGIDEPVVWAERLLKAGFLHRLLDEPARVHELEGWLPQLERERLELVTVAHLYALLDTAATVATERDCTQSAVFYCWAYHLCHLDGRPRAPGLEPPRFWTRSTGRVAPLPREGPRELEPTPHAKATHNRFKRLRESYLKDREAACRRRDQSAKRGSLASVERAAADIERLDRATLVYVSTGDLRPEPERKLMLKRAREPPWTGPFFEGKDGLHVGAPGDGRMYCHCGICQYGGDGTSVSCGWGQTQSPRVPEADQPDLPLYRRQRITSEYHAPKALRGAGPRDGCMCSECEMISSPELIAKCLASGEYSERDMQVIGCARYQYFN